jgi:predicted membrane protein
MSAKKSQGRIFWGLLLIVVGVLFLLDQMDRVDFGDLVSRYWPVVFILIGISILLNNARDNAGAGIFFILFGGFFLLMRLRILDHSVWHYAWPVAIIAVGAWILFRPALCPGKKKIPEVTGDDLDLNLVFSGTKRRVDSQSFKGGKAEVVFGSAEIDLRGARMDPAGATVSLSAVFGSIEVFVPRDWQVIVEGSPVLGSIDSRKMTVPDAEKTGTLRILASAVFGSVEIKE